MNIIVLGDYMLDKYIYCNPRKINSESPNIVFNSQKTEFILGGAANVCNNLNNLNFNIFPVTIIGNDFYGNKILELLESAKISTNYIIKANRITTLKTRYISNNHQVFRIDNEITDSISKNLQQKIVENVRKIINENTISGLIISDYNKGILTTELLNKIIYLSKNNKITIFVDPKKNFSDYQNSTILKPNRNEYLEICKDLKIENKTICKENLKIITNKLNLDYLIVTLDKDGIIYYDRILDKSKSYPIPSKYLNKVVDVTGAGDIVLSTIVYFYLKYKDIDNAIQKANEIGAYSVTTVGCLQLTDSIINNLIKINKKIINWQEIKLLDRSKKIIFTNGCFDLFHIGHLDYLQKSKELGDILIIGLNSDNSIKNIKGPQRPIIIMKLIELNF